MLATVESSNYLYEDTDPPKKNATTIIEPYRASVEVLAVGTLLAGETSVVPPVAVAIGATTLVVVGAIVLYEGVHAIFQNAADFKKNFAKSKPGKAAEVSGAEHTNARPSTRNKHEQGQTNKQQVNRDKKRQPNMGWTQNPNKKK